MVTSSSSDYDYDYSSSSSDEDSKVPEMKISTAESRAKMDQSLKKAKEAINDIRLASEEKLRSRPDGVASDSDAEEEPVWEPKDRKIKPHRLTREIERLVEADLEAERKKEEYWDAMYSNPDEREYFGDDSNSDSEEEHEEDSTENDDGDDESDESDD
ncbi:coiled-coil domain-containing protein 1-like [Papaver somniferum]|uniref:coiled-coil domain-containing protein 1-like n=1 Tax=Papaver somniferum TaxID=3469 RepID=UPI000E6F7AC7|nr:coiled-coil domain-containing protein 1-like [Papaver somniferum]